ncbi:MAG: hypothetical protein ABSF90_07570, partial [Syntrophobacteraceae bacterium]
FGFALYTVEARRMLQVRARFLVRALCECPVRGRNPHFVSGPRLILSARAQVLQVRARFLVRALCEAASLREE